MNDMTITYANILLIHIIILRDIIHNYVCIYVIHVFYTHYICGVELGSIRMYILVCTYVCMYIRIISYF